MKILWDKCSPALQQTVWSIADYVEHDDDMEWLLTRTEVANGGVNRYQNKHRTLYKALTALVNIRQKPQTSNTLYYNDFCTIVDHLKIVGGKLIIWSEKLIAHVTGMMTVSIKDKKEDEERFLAVMFVMRSNFNRFNGEERSSVRGHPGY